MRLMIGFVFEYIFQFVNLFASVIPNIRLEIVLTEMLNYSLSTPLKSITIKSIDLRYYSTLITILPFSTFTNLIPTLLFLL